MASTADLLAGAEDITDVLQRLAVRTQELTAAEFAAISTFDDHGKMERFIYTGMDEDQARRLGDPPRGLGLLGELAAWDRPLRLDDLTMHASSVGWPSGHPDMAPFIGVPIRVSGRTIGSLYMTRGRGALPFTEADEFHAAVLALQAGLSVAAALAQQRTGRLVLLEERERIAHDLHDGTIQSLYALGLEYDTLSNRSDFPGEVREKLSEAVDRINQQIADIRHYITMLESPAPTTEPELARDLAFVVRQIVPSGIDSVVNVTAAALQELSARDAEDLLYIAREALSNAVRHATPSRIAVDLRQSTLATSLTLQDNGVGFNEATARTGLGTVTMRTRAGRLGGELTVLSIPGMGTTVRVAIPRKTTNA
jgi:signal transduction histidine kinase